MTLAIAKTSRMPNADPKALAARIIPRLEAERAELKTLSEHSAAARAPVALDQQSVGRVSRGDAMQGQAMAQDAERRRRKRLVMIDAAIRRAEDGEFGYCVSCGEPIAEKRLELDPAATECIVCARMNG